MNVYYRKSAALVLKLRQEASKQLASSVVTASCKFALPVQAAKTLAVASEQGYSTFVCVHKHN